MTLRSLHSLHKNIAAEIDSQNYNLLIAHPDKMTQAPLLLQYLQTKSAYYSQEPLRICYEYLLQLPDNFPLANRLYENYFRSVRKKSDQRSVRSATHQLTSCYHVRERMIEAYGVFPDVSYLGIDATILKPQKVKQKNQVLFVGNKDNPIDGYELAEAALALIPKKIRPQLVTVEWKNANNERLTDRELAELYSSSITTLCMSRLETFGLVPLESMACGIAPIATRVSGHRETVLDKKTGLLAEFRPEDIAEKILFLINNPKERITMGTRAREYVVSEWNWQKRIDELETHINRYVANK
jgi:glycosyltransferase involved in cell wall biosynthesis